MKVTAILKDDVSISDALQTFIDIAEIENRIENDPHTNKHYILKEGKMWKKGDGTGKYWELFCNSREAQRDAREIFNID